MQLRLCPLHEGRRSTNCRTCPFECLGHYPSYRLPLWPSGTGARAKPTYMDKVLTRGIVRRGPALLGGRVMLRRITYVGEKIALYGFWRAIAEAFEAIGGSPYRRREVSSWLSAGWRAGQDTAQASCMDCLPLSRPEQRRGNIPTVD